MILLTYLPKKGRLFGIESRSEALASPFTRGFHICQSRFFTGKFNRWFIMISVFKRNLNLNVSLAVCSLPRPCPLAFLFNSCRWPFCRTMQVSNPSSPSAKPPRTTGYRRLHWLAWRHCQRAPLSSARCWRQAPVLFWSPSTTPSWQRVLPTPTTSALSFDHSTTILLLVTSTSLITGSNLRGIQIELIERMSLRGTMMNTHRASSAASLFTVNEQPQIPSTVARWSNDLMT